MKRRFSFGVMAMSLGLILAIAYSAVRLSSIHLAWGVVFIAWVALWLWFGSKADYS